MPGIVLITLITWFVLAPNPVQLIIKEIMRNIETRWCHAWQNMNKEAIQCFYSFVILRSSQKSRAFPFNHCKTYPYASHNELDYDCVIPSIFFLCKIQTTGLLEKIIFCKSTFFFHVKNIQWYYFEMLQGASKVYVFQDYVLTFLHCVPNFV